MKQKCKSLGSLVLVLGIAGSMVLAVLIGQPFGKSPTAITTTLGIFLGTLIPSIMLSVILSALGEVLEKLENAEKKIDACMETIKELAGKETWKCPVCGKENPISVKVCECGQESYDEFKKERS